MGVAIARPTRSPATRLRHRTVYAKGVSFPLAQSSDGLRGKVFAAETNEPGATALLRPSRYTLLRESNPRCPLSLPA